LYQGDMRGDRLFLHRINHTKSRVRYFMTRLLLRLSWIDHIDNDPLVMVTLTNPY